MGPNASQNLEKANSKFQFLESKYNTSQLVNQSSKASLADPQSSHLINRALVIRCQPRSCKYYFQMGIRREYSISDGDVYQMEVSYPPLSIAGDMESDYCKIGVIQELQKGVHYYKFIVDDVWRFNPEDPSRPDGQGNINNFIDTTTYLALAQIESEQNMSGNLQQSFREQKQSVSIQQFGFQAPRLPTHFQRCMFMDIKQQPKQQKEQQQIIPMEVQGRNQIEQILQTLTKQQLGEVFESSHSLQAPLHVCLNHVRMKDNKKFNVYSISHRFGSKFTTYKFLTYKKD